ncbi:MAG TPA: MauE/DoxX family redox-associated membrane protein [Verrucomicrobiae bacterium]|nr:MauE/DoxX family redox-associated membrane protein [Verrucomicrobiae bacterium]
MTTVNVRPMEFVSLAESIGRMVAGGVLFAAGLVKLWMGPQSFARAILDYRLIPAALAVPLARALPAMEIVIGAALLTGLLVRPAVLAGTALLVIFSGAVAAALARGQRNACGCGVSVGARRGVVSRRLIARNAFLTALLWVAYIGTEGVR